MQHHKTIKTVTGVLLTISLSGLFSCHQGDAQKESPAAAQAQNWFPYYDFDAAAFKQPPQGYGPYTRWWWPGNDVTSEELKREIRLLADHGFSGVEIQPLTVGLNFKSPPEQAARVYSWNTPSFYEHVKAVMDQAKESGITVDMNGGSGWPISSPGVKPEESMHTLLACDTTVAGGQALKIPLPKKMPDISRLPTLAGMSMFTAVDPSLASLQAVVAAKIIRQNGAQTLLDLSSVKELTTQVSNNQLSWNVPQGGEWKIIAFWSAPDGEKPALIATQNASYIPDHFDSVQLFKVYEDLFGKRTGLDQYYGKPFRAIFNDSYEFKPDRHFSKNFLAYFQAHRGYDIRPLLAANIQKGYNNAFANFLMPAQQPVYILSDEDWRIRYDYDQTVGDLLREQFINSSNRWMQARGILHRTQAYGVKMDMIAASGAAGQPEAEQLFAEGSEGFIKLVTSGAHLYNRPVISQESVVFSGRAEMTTPQKIRMLADKSFAEGINQFIYHGTPYKYQTGEYGREGWNAWSSSFMPMFNFSSDINESFPYWKNMKAVNEYISRSQYALRSGKPHTDVLIYFPFVDFGEGNITANPEEILAKGELKGIEPAIQTMSLIAGDGKKMTPLQEWYARLWPVVNALNASGITWDFINDASLQQADITNGLLSIRGNHYQALLLLNEPYVQLATAQKIKDYTSKGLKLLITGAIPDKQPSYLNYKENDAQTQQLLQDAAKQNNTTILATGASIDGWIHALVKEIRFKDKYPFTRIIDRDMKNGDRLEFIWNQSDQWQTVALTADAAYKNFYWLDAAEGTIVKNAGSSISYTIPPYSAILLYASKSSLDEKLMAAPLSTAQKGHTVTEITGWNIKAGDATVTNSALFDWRTKEAFQYRSGEGIYTASFRLDKKAGKQYFIDLGKVYFTAEVSINGKPAGTALWAPYQLNITSLVQQGDNSVEIKVMATNRNEFIGEAVKKNPKYLQFAGKESTLMPAGLAGPVSVKEVD